MGSTSAPKFSSAVAPSCKILFMEQDLTFSVQERILSKSKFSGKEYAAKLSYYVTIDCYGIRQEKRECLKTDCFYLGASVAAEWLSNAFIRSTKVICEH